MKFWTDTEYKDERGAIVIKRVTQSVTPVDQDGSVQFFGKGMVIINSPMGDVPKEFEVELEADTIEDAFTVFENQMNEKAQDAANEASQEVIDEMKQRMQDKSSSIITPEQIRKVGFDPNIR